MTNDSNMIVRNDDNQITGIRIAGINFSTKEAFIQYRENHQFKVGDAVQALVKGYSDAKVVPACICGINDFGGNRVSIDVCYVEDDYSTTLKFDSVYSDEVGAEKKSGVVGISPVNEFTNVGLRFTSVMETLNNRILSKETELAQYKAQLAMLQKFVESQNK